MPRRKEAPGRGAPRRTRRGGDDRKPAALMDIVVGAVRRLGALMGVSVTDIERCAVAEGDLPARAGARSILRLGLNRAVESGRLQRLPGGLFRLPGDAPDAVKGDEEAVKSLSGAESMEVDDVGGREEEEGVGVGVGVGVGEGEGEGFGEEEEQLVHMPNDASYDRLPLQLQPFDQLPPEQLKAPRGEKRRRGRSPCEPLGGGGGGGGERSAAEHGRAACAALFKLSADVISVIAQTAAARLSGLTADDARAGVGARDDAGHDDDDDDANAHDTPRKKKKKGGPDSSMDLLGDTQEVVGATGSALSEIAVAATRGAARVLEVSCEAADSVGGGARGGATKEAIFRTFKEAAMDIVRAARAFGEALGGASEEAVLDDDPERPDSALSRDADNDNDNDADAQAPDKDCGVGGGGGAAPAPDGDGSRGAEDDALDVLDLCDDDDDDLDEDGDATRGLLIGCDPPDDPSCIDAAPSPDMEDFLRNLLQDVRELTQRVGNRIN